MSTLSAVLTPLTPVQIDLADLQSDADDVGRSAARLEMLTDLFDTHRRSETSDAERAAMEQATVTLLREVARGLQTTGRSIASSTQSLEQALQARA
jgi:hypothetical protein